MGNKPEAKQLQVWWKKAILEGLEGKGHFFFLHFKMAYWASILHNQPLNRNINDKNDPLFINEPYLKESYLEISSQNSEIKKRIRDRINDQLDKLFLEKDGTLNFSYITDFIIRHFAKDLDAYYNEDHSRDVICRKLADTLYRNRRKKILLIAHSMGSIITLDVLTKYVPEVKIHTLVTIGSPLGIPIVRSRILSDLKNEDKNATQLKTPENIKKAWYNLADFKDRVAMSYDLKNDFLPNKRMVQPEDLLVHNNYEYDGENNHHKSYGYLRCPEMGNILEHFLKVSF